MRTLRLVLCAPALAVLGLLTHCAACSEECVGSDGAPAGCACFTDQDCGAQAGAVLLCVDGVCAVGDPEDVASPLGACDDGGTCPDGAACGVTGACHPAPRCQRVALERLVAVDVAAGGGAGAAVEASLDGCVHSWVLPGTTADAPARFTIALDGVMQFTDDSGPCQQGAWRAGQRAGVLRCGGASGSSTVVVVPEDDELSVCFGADCHFGCVLLEAPASEDDWIGVCP